MKKKVVFLMATLMALPTIVRGFDYQGLDYEILDEASKTCELVGVIDQTLTSIELPEQVVYGDETYTLTYIGYGAFMQDKTVETITLPKTVTTIDDYAFYECRAMIYVSSQNPSFSDIDGILFDKNQTEIVCFPTHESLTEYEIPSTVKTIGFGAFSGCENLQSLIIPEGVTTIDEAAFYNSTSLTEIIIPSTVSYIGAYAFYNCENLTSITLPKSLTSVEMYTFYNCESLSKVVIPEGVTSIGMYAFAFCSRLSSVTIPSTVKDFDDDIWFVCNNIREVYYAAEDPVAADEDIFPSTVYENAKFYMPDAGVEKAATVAPWNKFTTTDTYIPESNSLSGIDDIDVNTEFATEVYNLGGVKVANSIDNLPAGLYIVREGRNTRKVVVK